MAISSSSLSGKLFTILSSKGYVGSDLATFCDAVGSCINIVTGGSYTTVWSGNLTGSAVGTGNGITLGSFANLIYSTAVSSFNSSGPDLLDLCDSIETAFQQELLLAQSVTSFSAYPTTISLSGSGFIVPKASLNSSMLNSVSSFIGEGWPQFTEAVATGVELGFKNATVTYAIAGAPAGAPPSPLPNLVVPASIV